MSSFSEVVAICADATPERAGQVMDEMGIVLQPQPAAPVPLKITRIAFSGTKAPSGADPEPFDVDYSFEDGLTAVTSEKNLVGKSTILWLIRWALTGRRPADLADDVREWIEEVTVEGVVGTECFVVHWTLRDGATHDGSLTTSDGAGSSFSGQPGFAEAMGAFMLDRLRLSPTPWWKSQRGGSAGEGAVSVHGWPSYFPALLVRGDQVGVLLGENFEGGQAVTLLQVFLGLPWALTHQSASTVLKDLSHKQEAANRRARDDAKARDTVLKPTRDRLAAVTRELSSLASSPGAVSPDDADARVQAFATSAAAVATAAEQLAQAQQDLEVARADADELTKQLSALREDAVIVPLIGRVSPVACPRCTTEIAEERRAEEKSGNCMVCDVRIEAPESEAAAIGEAAGLAKAAQGAVETTIAAYAAAKAVHAAAVAANEEARSNVDAVSKAAETTARTRALQIERARLEGRVEQAGTVALPPAEEDDRQAVIDCARAEAERRRAEAAKNLLEELGKEIVYVAHRFGFSQLEDASPKLNASLAMRVAGKDSNFGRRSPGEKLRLKLAMVIALLRVGERLGIGRHPGLLLVDSPGGEEMVELDVGNVLKELDDLCKELPHLQVVCATARADDVRALLPDERIIHGPDWIEVW
jgi:hypothetical protein